MLENMIYLGLDYCLTSSSFQMYGEHSDEAEYYALVIADLQKVRSSLSYDPKRNTSTGGIFDSEKLKVLRNQLSPSDYLKQAANKEKISILGLLKDTKARFDCNIDIEDILDPNDIDLSQSRVEIFEGVKGEIIVSFKLQNKRYEILASLFFALVFMGATIGVEKGEICREWAEDGVFTTGMLGYVARRGFESQLLAGLKLGLYLEDVDNPETDIFVEMKNYFMNSVTNNINQLQGVELSAFLSCQILDYLCQICLQDSFSE